MKLCVERGVSPTQAVEAAGISRPSVGRWREGMMPKDISVHKLASYFDVTPEQLTGEAELPKAEATPAGSTFYERLVSLCSEKGVAVTRAVADMGFAKSITAKWRHGQVPRGNSLTRIAEYFGVTVDYLLDGEDKEKAAQTGGEDISATKALLHRLIETMPEDDAERAAKILLAAFPAHGE